MHAQRRGESIVCVALVLALFAWCSGCGQSDSDDFKAYRELNPPQEAGSSRAAGSTLVAKAGNGDRDDRAETEHPAEPNPRGKAPATAGSEPDESDEPSRSAENGPVEAVAPDLNGAAVGASGAGADPRALPDGDPNRTGDEKASAPREIKLLIEDKQFKVEGPEGAIRVTYDDINLLKVLNMEPVPPDAPRHFPEWLQDLDGRRIRIRGFMSPAFESTGLTAFLMGRDNQACCYPGRAKIYDLFPVKLREGETVNYIENRPFDVVGVFQIKPWVEDGELYRLYQIVDAVVIE